MIERYSLDQVFASGYLVEVANGCFVVRQFSEYGFGQLAALEKRDRLVWVARRPSSHQIHRRKAASEILISKSGLLSKSLTDS